ncbi:MAG: PPC domain-containing protein [Anaerolineales bacterium]|nr:PPC domain-containing protein [Anaerolineales bacterium]MCB8952525.1 PPC domain-containing protein [Ardenticatenales bacterium]
MMRIRSTTVFVTATLIIVSALLLIGCREGGAESTFAGWASGGTLPPLVNRTETLSLAELAQNPRAYAGITLQLTGQFHRAAPLVCSSVTRRSPAAWLLSDGQNQIAMGGSFDQLSRIAPDNLTITVVGRWWVWRGPVGCGKNLPATEVWYLDVSEIVAPNPLTNATLTPTDEEIAALPPTPVPPEIPPPPSETALPTAETPPPEATLPSDLSDLLTITPDLGGFPTLPPDLGLGDLGFTLTLELPPELLTPPVFSETKTATPTPSGSGGGAGTPTMTTTPTPTTEQKQTETPTPPVGLSPTATVTPTPNPNNTPTPTATTGPSPTPTPTATTGPSPTPTATVSGNLVDKGSLEAQDLVIEILAAGLTDQWSFVVDNTDVLTINVDAPVDMNMVVTVLDGNNNVIKTQDNATGGAPEIVVTELPGAGTYFIRVNEATGQSGSYSMILQDSGAYPFIFQGTLVYGDAESALIVPNSDHFWHFMGNQGDSIAILVAPNDNESDVFFELFGPDATDLLGEPVDDGGAGVPEFLISFTLPETGFYAIHVGEYNFAAADYSISLDSFSFP